MNKKQNSKKVTKRKYTRHVQVPYKAAEPTMPAVKRHKNWIPPTSNIRGSGVFQEFELDTLIPKEALEYPRTHPLFPHAKGAVAKFNRMNANRKVSMYKLKNAEGEVTTVFIKRIA